MRKSICGSNSSNLTLFDISAPFNPVVTFRNVPRGAFSACFAFRSAPVERNAYFDYINGPNGGSRRMFPMDCNARTCTGVAFGGSRALKLAQV